MTTTDLKPGDFVRHPEKGNGVVYDSTPSRVMHRNALGRLSSSNLDGWERVETVRPGHVQVRVDDLDLSHWLNKPDDDNIWGESARVAIRAANAIAAQRAESTPPAGEKPTSATVTLYCPDCGEAVTDTATVGIEDEGGYYLTFANSETHTCPPAQPDEPTEPGIHVSVCDMRLVSLMQNPAGGRLFADVKSGHIYDWDDLIERGTVTLGWDE